MTRQFIYIRLSVCANGDALAAAHLSIGPDGVSTTRTDGTADVVLSGSASDLYMAVWNRSDDSNTSITGEREVLDAWRANEQIRWG